METLKYQLQKYVDVLQDYMCQKILTHLTSHGPSTQRELRIKLRMDPSERRNLYRYVAMLTDINAIEEIDDPTYDRRLKLLQIVPTWQDHLQSIHHIIQDHEGHQHQE